MKNALHMYAENERGMKTNEAALNDQFGDLHTIQANDKIPDNCKYIFAIIQAAQNQKQTNTGGLRKLLKVKIGAIIMLAVNVDIQHNLINV